MTKTSSETALAAGSWIAIALALTCSVATGAATFTEVSAAAGLATGGGSAGAAWGDYDGDGCVDLAVSGTPNILYRSNCDGTFADVTGAAGIGEPLDGVGLAWGDYDGDDDLDLVIATRSAAASNVLYRNEGDGTFSDVTAGSGLDEAPEAIRAAGVSWADFDEDGDLDLFVANRFGDATFDKTDRLYRNNGDGTFTDVAVAAGVAGPDDRLSFMGVWADLDEDGDLDMWLSVDFDDDVLYSNNGDGTFSDVTAAAGIDDPQHGMGVAMGDPSNNGWIDVLSSNNHQGDTDPTHGPSVLYRNDTSMAFRDVTTNAQLLDRDVVEWGASFVDYDNDGDDDLSIVAGGMLSEGEPNILYENPGNGVFTDATAATGTENSGASFSSTWADYDDDGDLDWFVTNEIGSNVLFRNDGPTGNWLRVVPRGVLRDTRGIGAKMELTTGGDPRPDIRIVQAGESYLSAEAPEAFFGMASSAQGDLLRVIWPSGVIDEIAAPDANQTLTLVEGDNIVNGFVFHDEFDDDVLAGDWFYALGSWSEAGGVLTAEPSANGTAAAAAKPAFDGCGVCTLRARLRGDNAIGPASRVQLGVLAWFQNLRNMVVVVLKPEEDLLIFRQLDGGAAVQQISVPVTVDLGVSYKLETSWDGAEFKVWIDGELLIQTPNAAAAAPSGTFGLAARDLTLTASQVVAWDLD